MNDKERVEKVQAYWKAHGKRVEIFSDICDERERQDRKWGEQNHAPADWCMILGEEVGEINKAALESKFEGKTLEEYRKELIQTAAVCFSMIECLDRQTKDEFAKPLERERRENVFV